MIYLLMLVKTAGWLFAFWFGIRGGMRRMLCWAAAATLFLTAADVVYRWAGPAVAASLVTLLLYALMSFLLIPVAWKVRNPAVTLACHVAGTCGAYSFVYFAMNFLSTRLPL
ncbi:hypothetical protein L4X63_08480 [Geomonas sp. Red32]|uniref:hypothetical protein n=1 Tax=Geomonas sp. Red32 TaxID=2912856 RepID=UPI00202D08EA|nr:hypothetical protein [Geomonas sp. Red32]MCM0081620.1 hypothetical protein [Geomonas sp. Red32]